MPWGWLEVVVLAQTFIPALLFVPGLAPVRTLTRVSAFGIALVAWATLILWGRRRGGADSFPANRWLIACTVWLVLMLMHPTTDSPLAGLAHVGLYVAVFAAAFWAPGAVASSRQLPRIMALLFLCNALSATVGVAQVYRPDTFNPPVIWALEHGDEITRGTLTYTASDGRTIIRPCGLTDTPGAAVMAGTVAGLIGLCWALLPIAWWKRLASLGLAMAGVAVIYLSQVRTGLIVLVLCAMVLAVLLILQRDYRRSLMLLAGCGAILVGAMIWAIRSVGDVIFKRFETLWAGNTSELLYRSRGYFVEEAFNKLLWDYPLGAGLGRWGMIRAHFGSGSVRSIWVEVQFPAWIVDGGILLLLLYGLALAAAVLDALRIALTCPDRTVAYWAAVICAFNLSIVAMCYSFIPFLAPVGVQFWLLAGMLHGADLRARAEMRARRLAMALRSNEQ